MKYLLFALIALSGCTSLQHKVFTQIKNGDSREHVVSVLGAPDIFGQSMRYPDAMAMYYDEKDMVCGITIKDEKVAFYFCQQDPSYVVSGRAASRTVGTVQRHREL